MSDITNQNDSAEECEELEDAAVIEGNPITENNTQLILNVHSDLSKLAKANLPEISIPKIDFTPILNSICESISDLCISPDVLSSAMNALLPSLEVLKASVIPVSHIIENYAEAFHALHSPFLSILDSFDTSYISQSLKRIASIISEQFDPERIKKYLITVMAESRWFPYAGWIEDNSIFCEISDIVASSRGISARRTKRIDKVILTYYNKAKIKKIKSNWFNSDLPFHIKKILGQAIEAHLRNEYALTITCLATMWEGLILDKLHISSRQRMSKTKKEFAGLIEDNNFEPIFSEFYENYIVSDCNSEDDVIAGIPNRNGVSHSKYKKYPNQKASLNAILLTDFIINLKSKPQMEV